MKLIISLVLVAFVVGLGFQVFNLYQENQSLVTDVEARRLETEELLQENAAIQDDIEYFENDENLAKELKSRFDYRRPGETLIKIQ